MNIPKPYTFDRVVRMIISILVLGLIIYFLVITKTVLIPFFVAWFIAYLINPIVLFVQRLLRLKSKLVAVLIVLLLLLAIVTGVSWALIPRFVEELNKIVEIIAKLIKDNNLTKILPESFNSYAMEYIKKSEFLSSITAGDASEFIKKVFTVSWGIISESFAIIFAVLGTFITFVYLIFLSKDFETISKGAIDLIPHKFRDKAVVIIADVEQGMNRYYRGQATVAFIVGILLAIGFQIISLPMGFVLGLFIGMLNLIPYLQIVGIIPMALLALVQTIETGDSFLITMGLPLMVLAIVQVIQDVILVPKIMGRVTGLNPAVILLSLSIWGMLLGVIGMIIALPFTSILLSYYQRFIINQEPIENLASKEENPINSSEGKEKK